MKRIFLFATVVAAFACLPLVEAQDEKKPETPPETPKAKGPVRPSEDVVKAGVVFRGRIQEVRGDEKSREIVVLAMDPKLNQEFVQWDQKEQLAVVKDKNPMQRVEKYRKDYAKKLAEVFTGDPKTVVVNEIARVRTSYPPPQYDATGAPKKISAAELSKLKSLRLPGYAADTTNLRVGQIVDVTLPKPAATPKNQPPAKKDFIGVDPTLNVAGPRVDALMVYVVIDAK